MYNKPQEICLGYDSVYNLTVRNKNTLKALFINDLDLFIKQSLEKYKFDISNSVFLCALLDYLDEDNFRWEVALENMSQKEILNSLCNFFYKIEDSFALEALAKNKNISTNTMLKLVNHESDFVKIFLCRNKSVPKNIKSMATSSRFPKGFFNI